MGVLQQRLELMRHRKTGKNQNDGSDTDRAPVSHAPPCETVASRGQGAALYKCLPAARGPAGAPHMFVLWSSHTDADGFAGPRRPSWSRSCPFVASVWLLSTPPIISLSSFFRCSVAALSSDRSEVPSRRPPRQTGAQNHRRITTVTGDFG